MALNFPGSPSLNDTYTLGNRTWTWNGSAWDLTSNKIGYTGSAGTGEGSGYTGSVGYAGSVGYTGSAGTGYTGSAGTETTISKSITIVAPESNDNVSLFYTTSALVISKVRAVLTGSSTPSVTYSIKSGTDRSSLSETHVDAATVTNTTTGTDATVADSSISATTWVWLEISAVSGTVTSFSVTLEF